MSTKAANVPPGFTESAIAGPWADAVGIDFEANGRMYVWERTGKIWFKDPTDSSPTLLLDISEEVGAWSDYGMLGFRLDPNFRTNGYIYLLYVVDRYYLLHFGTPNYNPSQNAYFDATIGRLTRYTCRSSDGFRSIDPTSRLILIGETKQTGFPMCSDTHGVGSLVFGEDGTLLISCGDGASARDLDDGGQAIFSYAPQALADGIIRPKEDIGAFRAQLVDCLNGKVVRIDPATGNGIPSNPFYDAANPRSPRSRVWTLGLRNPFRMALRPNTGSHFPEDGNPGVLYIGNVGWDNWESLTVVTRPAQNFGWPIFEGLSVHPNYVQVAPAVFNLDAPNPLYPGSGCDQYFSFADLIKEDTLVPSGQPPFNNPCNSSLKIPTSIPQFLRTRHVLDWNHVSAITRTPIYDGSGQAQTANVGSGGSPVSGTQFQGNCAIGGVWYTGTNFPTAYQDKYYFADWGQGLIKTLTFDANDRPVALGSFASTAGAIVNLAQDPTNGSLCYIGYDYAGATITRLSYTGNRTPNAIASADRYYGSTPLVVQFSSNGSSDPDGQNITYSWNFGDGSAISTQANPAHTFSAPPGVPTRYVVTLTVTDSGGLSDAATLVVGVNDTPPNVTITSPLDGTVLPQAGQTNVNLTANVSDLESSDSQLLYQWQVLLHHNDHNHGNPFDTNHSTTATLVPTGCDGINIYYYRILLTVTDPIGLMATREVRLYPDCGPDTPPTISTISNRSILQDQSTGPINFTISDANVSPANLQLSATSSNPALVSPASIVFGGSGSNRTVNVTPTSGQTGSATITITVNDGPHNTSTSFVLDVIPSVTVTTTFTNSGAITIPLQGTGAPYPSTLNVTGMSGTITNVTLTLRNITHSWFSDVDVLLVGPSGQKLLALSDVGNGFSPNNITITLSDAASAVLPASGSFASGSYKPTDYAPADTFPAPAPAGPYQSTLSTFNGQVPNGIWSLYVFDDGNGDQGTVAGGWSLGITAIGPAGTPTPAPSTTPTPTATSTSTATATSTPTGTPPPSPTITPTLTPIPTPTTTPTVTPTSTPTPTPTPTPNAGLIAAYNFNEGNGSSAGDSSGHGITGTVQGATWTTGGKYGNALSFNGSTSYVDLGNPALLQITGSMTWSAWVKAAANPADDGQIIAKSDNTSGWQFKTSPDTGPHTFGVSVSAGPNSPAQRYSTTIRSLNVWYHVAGVYDATARTLNIYVNGVQDNGTLVGTIPSSQVNSAANVNIGRRTGGFYFNGIIDDVRLYNRALNQAEIQSDMNIPVGTLPTPTPTPTPPTPTPTPPTPTPTPPTPTPTPPTPTPTPPTPTPTPPTPTPTPTPSPINISGSISYCSNPAPGPVPDVSLNLTGASSGFTLSDASGNYLFASLLPGSNYTVTPSKSALAPGSPGISTIDVIAIQRHFLNIGTLLQGCRLMAADVSGDAAINTVDVIATQRFFLGSTNGIANVGQYHFSPVSRTYLGVVTDQSNQNYDALIFGDVANPFAQ